MTTKEMITDYEQKIFDKFGFDKDKLTDEQIEIILQPEWGPENFHQDGEISPAQAERFWIQRLRLLGVYNEGLVEYMLG
tara:strand:- start:93 stop:329 length:237 start_codon:yes stop_codon:yes gene_type:complete